MRLKLALCTFLAFNFIQSDATTIKLNPIRILPKVIYGMDNRSDVFESSDSLMREISRGTAAQISNDNLTLIGNSYNLKSKTLEEDNKCISERFSNQMIAANCSGFLISPDILVTAGHCVRSLVDCENNSWVFDYSNIYQEKSSFTFTKNQVFHCTKIIARQKDETTFNDFAVVKLDRPVVGRSPLKFRKNGKIANDAVLTVIGHPSGLPLKITSAADMRSNSNPFFFVTNSDTYGGNSGSAVVDSKTGIVEGILVRGDQDYIQNEDQACASSVHREQNDGRGEDATRITNIKFLQKKQQSL